MTSDAKDQRDLSAISHITIDGHGVARCERCGESFEASVKEALRFDMSSTLAWMRRHRACKPASYVS